MEWTLPLKILQHDFPSFFFFGGGPHSQRSPGGLHFGFDSSDFKCKSSTQKRKVIKECVFPSSFFLVRIYLFGEPYRPNIPPKFFSLKSISLGTVTGRFQRSEFPFSGFSVSSLFSLPHEFDMVENLSLRPHWPMEA